MLRSWLHLEGQEKSVAWSHKSPAVPEPNSAKHRAKYAKYTSSIIESIEPLRSIEFIRLQNCPTSGWLARLCWQTSPLWHKSEHPELICEHERHNLHIKTVQIHSAQVTTVLLSKRTTWEQHGLSLENWQQTRVVHVSSVSDLVLCSSLLETPKWHNVTCDTMWQNIWQCHSGLAKGKTMHRPLGQELFWRWLATLSWQESVPHFSGHVKAHSGLTIGFSPENLFTLIWIHMDPHPHLMEFSRLWYVMIALYSLWLYESMIIHINPWYSKESSGIFGIRPAWTGHQICSGLGRSSQWRPRCWLQWPGAGDGFGDGLVR